MSKNHPSKGKGTRNRTSVSCNHPSGETNGAPTSQYSDRLFGYFVGKGDHEGHPMVVMEMLNSDLPFLQHQLNLNLSRVVDIMHAQDSSRDEISPQSRDFP